MTKITTQSPKRAKDKTIDKCFSLTGLVFKLNSFRRTMPYATFLCPLWGNLRLDVNDRSALKPTILFSFLLVLSSLTLTAAPTPSVKFIRNEGQWENSIRFRADIPGGYLLVKNTIA